MTDPAPALFLFDLDATLVHTGGAGLHAIERAGRAVFGDEFRAGDYNTAGMLDPVIFSELTAANSVDAADAVSNREKFQAHYFSFLREELAAERWPYRVLPGVHDLLTLLRRRVDDAGDVVLGMLTGNYGQAVPIKLEPGGIDLDWFTVTAFGDEARTRPDMVALALQRYEQRHGFAADPRRVYVIGDTPKDVACAHAHGCVAIGVATGRYDAATLRDAGADAVLDDLSRPEMLLVHLDGA